MVSRKYAYCTLKIYGDGETKTLTYDLPDDMPIPAVGDSMEVIFGGLTTRVTSRMWSIRDRVEIRLQGIWANPPDDASTAGWTVDDARDVDDLSNDLHSAGWQS